MVTTADFLDLAPADLPIFSPGRYDGGGLGVGLDRLAPPDRAIVRLIYHAVLRIADARPAADATQPGPDFAAALREAGEDWFLEVTRTLGEATRQRGLSAVVGKALHDARGGALVALVGAASWPGGGPPPPFTPADCGRLARDHCKILRNAFPDLDPDRRRHDEERNDHDVGEFVRTWDGLTVRGYGREAAVSVRCTYRGGVAASCLENAAVDRILYNHVNNAARFSADGRVQLDILGVGGRLIRWVVRNTTTDAHREWLARAAGPDLWTLYRGGVTAGGQGVGLSACADFVAAAFGLPSAATAVTNGYLGATVVGNEYRAWFHWPAYRPGAADPVIAGR